MAVPSSTPVSGREAEEAADRIAGIEAVAEFMGGGIRGVPLHVVSEHGVPWDFAAALGIAYRAGLVSERTTHAETARRLAIARVVAESWREAFMAMKGQLGGHGLACTLSALDGETDPVELGIDPTTDVAAAIRALVQAVPTPTEEQR